MNSLKTLIALFCLVFATAAHAQEESAADAGMQLNQGDWEVGGSLSYSRIVPTRSWSLNLSPSVEYFFLNRFSAGGTVIYQDTDRTDTSTSFGPSLSYYFLIAGRTAWYVDQAILLVNPSGTADNYFSGATGIGFNHFYNPYVGVGPVVRTQYYFGGDRRPDNGWSVQAVFSIYL